jgi:hypothetical protein
MLNSQKWEWLFEVEARTGFILVEVTLKQIEKKRFHTQERVVEILWHSQLVYPTLKGQ